MANDVNAKGEPSQDHVSLPANLHWVHVKARCADTNEEVDITYNFQKQMGKGRFGTVHKILTSKNQTFALKEINYNKKHRLRDAEMMKDLEHVNLVSLFYIYTEKFDKRWSRFYLILEFVPEDLATMIAAFSSSGQTFDEFTIKLYSYQILRGIAYIHNKCIIHRDIKPGNILIDSSKGIAKICDFGSAKSFQEVEKNVLYICSRWYRAPELLLDNSEYNCAIDVWSMGCVIAELYRLQPIFVGENSFKQLENIVSKLGSAEVEPLLKLHPKLKQTSKYIEAKPMADLLLERADPTGINFLMKVLRCCPSERIEACLSLNETFFDALRHPAAVLPSGQHLPELFNFTELERSYLPKINP